jgi:hypothetical protein
LGVGKKVTLISCNTRDIHCFQFDDDTAAAAVVVDVVVAAVVDVDLVVVGCAAATPSTCEMVSADTLDDKVETMGVVVDGMTAVDSDDDDDDDDDDDKGVTDVNMGGRLDDNSNDTNGAWLCWSSLHHAVVAVADIVAAARVGIIESDQSRISLILLLSRMVLETDAIPPFSAFLLSSRESSK